MKVGHLIATVVETIIKVVVLAVAVMFIVRGATKAYDFGYRVFADKPVSVSGGRTITVGVSENMSVKDIAAMLEEKTEFVQTYFANPDFQNFVNARVFQAAVSQLSSQRV